MVEIKSNEFWPIVYRDEYNVKFFGLEKLHPFDSKKWGHIYKVSIILENTIESYSIGIILFLLFVVNSAIGQQQFSTLVCYSTFS